MVSPKPNRKYTEKAISKILASVSFFLSIFLHLPHIFNYVQYLLFYCYEPIQTEILVLASPLASFHSDKGKVSHLPLLTQPKNQESAISTESPHPLK